MSVLLTRDAAERRALEITIPARKNVGVDSPWRPVCARRLLPRLNLPHPFHPENSTGPRAWLGEHRGPLPPAWYVELRARQQHGEQTYEVLLGMLDGRLLASVAGMRV